MTDHPVSPAPEEAPPENPEPPSGFFAFVADALAGRTGDLTSVPLKRAVILLAIPMMLELVLESVFALCDALFVSRLGTIALNAVGLTESLMMLVYSACIGLAMATGAMVARRFGEKDPEAASVVGVQAIILGGIISVMIAIPGIVYAEELLLMMKAAPDEAAYGAPFMQIMLGGNVVIVMIFLINGIYRGAGDAAMAMRSLWLANGINLVLDPCLIFGLGPFPELGLRGAAIATVIGRGCGVLFQVWFLMRGTRGISIRASQFRIDLHVMRRLLGTSWNGMLQFFISTASQIIVIRMMSRFGDVAVASWTVSIRVLMFVLMPVFGMSNAAATLVGQNLGAKRPERAERAVYITGTYASALMAFATVVILVFDRWLIGLFPADDPSTGGEFSELAVTGLRIVTYGNVFYAWGMVLMQAFNGAGDTGTPMRANIFVFWMWQLPVTWWLAERLGPEGIFWGVASAYSLNAVVAWFLFRRGKWKSKIV